MGNDPANLTDPTGMLTKITGSVGPGTKDSDGPINNWDNYWGSWAYSSCFSVLDLYKDEGISVGGGNGEGSVGGDEGTNDTGGDEDEDGGGGGGSSSHGANSNDGGGEGDKNKQVAEKPKGQQIAEQFSLGLVDGLTSGVLSTVDFFMSLGTEQGWLSLGNGLNDMAMLG